MRDNRQSLKSLAELSAKLSVQLAELADSLSEAEAKAVADQLEPFILDLGSELMLLPMTIVKLREN